MTFQNKSTYLLCLKLSHWKSRKWVWISFCPGALIRVVTGKSESEGFCKVSNAINSCILMYFPAQYSLLNNVTWLEIELESNKEKKVKNMTNFKMTFSFNSLIVLTSLWPSNKMSRGAQPQYPSGFSP